MQQRLQEGLLPRPWRRGLINAQPGPPAQGQAPQRQHGEQSHQRPSAKHPGQAEAPPSSLLR
ncbi:hypothetical protein SynRS9909_01450 [Synechococcus sp. RS9909]|nr:hypothetical protein SynRS9909_01450 [Synechococcus sp. RS9909]